MINDKYLEKPLPSNADAEQHILGAILLENEAGEDAYRQLVPSDFQSPIHRKVFQVMVELHEAGTHVDPITITECIKSHGDSVEPLGGTQAITDMIFGVPHFANIKREIELVKKHSIARQSVKALMNSVNAILSETVPLEDVLDNTESQLLNFSSRINSEDANKESSKGFYDLRDITPTLKSQFENYHAGIATGAPTGMQELDDLLDGGGVQPGGVYLVAASEKTGKTSLALDWGSHGATKLGLTVPIVTLEMSRENMAKRLYSAYTGIPYYRFRPGFYDSGNDNSYTRAIEGLKEFGELSIKIADRLFGIHEIARHLRRVVEIGLKSGKPVKYAIIDYLQLIEAGLVGNSNREREVSGISRALKKLAAELGIALIVMSSLNRDGLKEGQEPTPFNLRDSGQLAFDCEALIMLHNPAYIPGKPYEPKQITDMVMILSRQRNGPQGRIPMKFIGPYMQFMTESQYRKHFRGDGLPQSVGQAMMEDKEFNLLWDNDDDKNDKQGEDVPWD